MKLLFLAFLIITNVSANSCASKHPVFQDKIIAECLLEEKGIAIQALSFDDVCEEFEGSNPETCMMIRTCPNDEKSGYQSIAVLKSHMNDGFYCEKKGDFELVNHKSINASAFMVCENDKPKHIVLKLAGKEKICPLKFKE